MKNKLTKKEIYLIISMVEDVIKTKPEIILSTIRDIAKENPKILLPFLKKVSIYLDTYEFESSCGLGFFDHDLIKKIENL